MIHYADKAVGNRFYVALVLYDPKDPTVWLYPRVWEEEMALPYKQLLIALKDPNHEKELVENKKKGSKARISFAVFCERCSAGGAALQDEIREKFKSLCKLLYGGKTMTVNFNDILLRISNSCDERGECISEMSPQFRENLLKELPELRDAAVSRYIKIPTEIDRRFVAAIVNGIESTIE